MNPDLPKTPREEKEARLTAWLLGEVPPEEANVLREEMQNDAELAQLHDRLKQTIAWVREVEKAPANAPAPAKLSPGRRSVLLRHFQQNRKPQVEPSFIGRIAWYVPLSLAAALVVLLALAGLGPDGWRNFPESMMDFAKKKPQSTTPLPGMRAAASSENKEIAGVVDRESSIREGESSSQQGGNRGWFYDDGVAVGQTAPVSNFGLPQNQPAPATEPTPPAQQHNVNGVAPASGPVALGGGVMYFRAPEPTAAPLASTPSGRMGGGFGGGGFLEGRQLGRKDADVKAKANVEFRQDFDSLSAVPAAPAASIPPPPPPSMPLPALQEEQLERSKRSVSRGTSRLYENNAPVPTDAAKAEKKLAARTAQPRGQALVDQSGPQQSLERKRDLAAGKPLDNLNRSNADQPAMERFYSYSGLSKERQEGVKRRSEVASGEPSLKASDEVLGFALKQEAVVELKDSDADFAGRELREVPTKEAKILESDKSNVQADDYLARGNRAALPQPQPEIDTRENAFSTFSLNVTDVSFKLAGAALDQNQMPDPTTVRVEEFINAFDYRDPEPTTGNPVALAWERARYPFAANRDLLRFSVKTAVRGREAGRPMNLVLLLDNSGSMERADRERIIREALPVLCRQLTAQDRVSVITFARTPRLWVDAVAGDQSAEVLQKVGEQTPEGGTNLEAAMDLAYQTAARHFQAGGVNRVVLLTDGAANLGNIKPQELKEKVTTHRKQGIALDCFGIGWEGYDDEVLETLARHGDGRYGFLNSPEEAATEFAGQLAGALQVAAADVKVQVEFNPARVTTYRQLGYAKHQLTKEQFRDNTVDAAEMGAAEAGNALYVIQTNPRGEGSIGTVRVRYRVPATGEYTEHSWDIPYAPNPPALDQAGSALRLAATSAAFAEWLTANPYASEVTTDRLLGLLRGVPDQYPLDPRPQRLEWMIRQAKAISGK